MLQFMGDNKKLLHTHEQKFAELEALKYNSQMFQSNTNASLNNLETRVGQLALTLQNQNKNAFPSYTQKNPNDDMVVQLRSGKEMSNNIVEDKENTDKKEEKATREDNKRSRTKKTTEAEKQVHTKQLEKSNEQKQKEKVKAYTPEVPFPQRIDSCHSRCTGINNIYILKFLLS